MNTYQPSKEEICALFESALFVGLKDLSTSQIATIKWWFDQPSKNDVKPEASVAFYASVDLDSASSKMLAFVKANPGCARRDVLKATGLKDVKYGAARKTLMEKNYIRQEGNKITSRFFAV